MKKLIGTKVQVVFTNSFSLNNLIGVTNLAESLLMGDVIRDKPLRPNAKPILTLQKFIDALFPIQKMYYISEP